MQLIQELPSLRSLTLYPPPYHLKLSGIAALKNLESITFGRSRFDRHCRFLGVPRRPDYIRDEWSAVSRNFFLSGLHSLKLEHVSFSTDDHEDHQKYFNSSTLRQSPLKTLRLLYCVDTEDPSKNEETLGFLPDVLSSIKHLERLTLRYRKKRKDGWRFGNPGVPRVHPSEFAAAVRPHAPTLTELIIVANEGADFQQGGFGSMAQYVNLRRVGAPDTFFVDDGSDDPMPHDEFPPMLEELQVQSPLSVYDEREAEIPGDFFMEKDFHFFRSLADGKEHHRAFTNLTRVVWWIEPLAPDDIGNDWWESHERIYLRHPDMGLVWQRVRELGDRLRLLHQ